MKKLIFLLATVMLVSGCANPSYFRKNTQFTPTNWARVAVLPFSGDERFTQVATDTFNLHLLGQDDFEVLEPSTMEFAVNKIVAAEDYPGSITILQAQRVGQLVNADAIFLGNVTSYNNGITFNAFPTLKMIDPGTGKIVAVSHKPSGLLFGWSEHQCAVTAVERVAKDMLKALKDLAAENKTMQTSDESNIEHNQTYKTNL